MWFIHPPIHFLLLTQLRFVGELEPISAIIAHPGGNWRETTWKQENMQTACLRGHHSGWICTCDLAPIFMLDALPVLPALGAHQLVTP